MEPEKPKTGRPNLTERRTIALEKIALSLSILTDLVSDVGFPVNICTRNGLNEVKYPIDVIVHQKAGKR
jgi:hypothetical protein